MNHLGKKIACMAIRIVGMGMLFVIPFMDLYAYPIQTEDLKPVTPKDYGKWESLGRGGALSPDGNWLIYPIRRNNKNAGICSFFGLLC